MKIKGIDFRWFGHDTFRIQVDDTVIYTDPYKLEKADEADIILSSHEHHDHCDVDSIKKIVTENTTIITTPLAKEKVANLPGTKLYLTPGNEKAIEGITIRAVPAYNVNKFRSPGTPYHPKGKKLGFLISVNDTTIYFAGDTDVIDEMDDLGPVDIALLPISGKYVMTVDEAVEAVKKIRPNIVIPMHVGADIGSLDDTEKFKEKVETLATVKILELE